VYERVVVGVSKATTGREAGRQAQQLAAAYGATLHFVYAFGSQSDELSDKEPRHAQSFVDQMAAACDVQAVGHAMPGDPADVILQVAEEVGADLIVVGNQGMRGVRRVLGSVPNKVAHHAPCSVLIVNTT
jgi:nucleotide-binding universal stress UspA family protein